jgi:hypothetical protein
LVASCLEAVGLHPLLLIVEGHAATAVWLTEVHLPIACIDDPLRLHKRAQVGDLCALDPAAAAARPPIPFEAARKSGERCLRESGKFLVAIDVAAARAHRILPLPSRIWSGSAFVEPSVADLESALVADSDLGQIRSPDQRQIRSPELGSQTVQAPINADPIPLEAPAPPEPADLRLGRWKTRLLDLSLRNRLLNYRETKQSVPLECADVGALEDALAQGRELVIWPKPALMEDKIPEAPRPTSSGRVWIPGRPSWSKSWPGAGSIARSPKRSSRIG